MYRIQLFTCGEWHSYSRVFTQLEARDIGGHMVVDSAETIADAALHTGSDKARILDHRNVVVMHLAR